MATDTNVYTGTATIQVLTDITGRLYSPIYTSYTWNLNTIPIIWNAVTGTPPGSSSGTLAATFPQGYVVAYNVYYNVIGEQYNDPGAVNVLLTQLKSGSITIPAPVPQNIPQMWNYGSNLTGINPALKTPYNLNIPPQSINYRFDSTSTFNYPQNDFSWGLIIIVTVTKSCTLGDIDAPLCLDICNADPQSCYVTYAEHCLTPGNEERIGMPICKNYISEYISRGTSTPQIDAATRRYCALRYHGFADLFSPNPNVSPQQQANDLPICACNLTAAGSTDPDLLYNNYYKSLIMKDPALANVPFQPRCLLGQCAAATFLPVGIPPGGCKLPACLNIVTINNDGTINGNVTVNTSAECQNSLFPGENIIVFILIIILVLVVIVIIIYIIRTMTTTNPPKIMTQRVPLKVATI
jgi:hypothetical protein